MNIDTSNIETALKQDLNPNGTPALNLKEFANVAMNLARFREIQALSPLAKTAEIQAELEGLIEALSKSFLDHGEEWTGCWYVVNTEYMPLVRSLAPLFRRVNGRIVYEDNQQAKQQDGLAVTDEARNGN